MYSVSIVDAREDIRSVASIFAVAAALARSSVFPPSFPSFLPSFPPHSGLWRQMQTLIHDYYWIVAPEREREGEMAAEK